MIVDNSGETVDVTLVLKKPVSEYLKQQLEYILDTISELETDYDFAHYAHENTN